ncbi:glycosyltransferase [Thalassococcus profundi]|uniref:Glycosyltransferase n=1 Tax=Thalassococcus profundi TaxID=2282382 RepID=A0A369TSG5_9RHOB|nr:WecB/TagA/CpsF family glycosyltransferase [Thalassococcus profundi]RDD67822.1 glycosyltransferase [Thalassococcus profundi]
MDFYVKSQRVQVNVATWAGLKARVAERLARREGFALATINLDHLVKLRASPEFRAAYAAQDMVVADGNPIVWMSRVAGKPVELIPGSEVILPMCRIAARQGVTVALVGSTPPALQGAKSYLEREVHGLSVVATISPPFGFDPEGAEARAILEEINESGAGLCFVALGAPKQEMFCAAGRLYAPEIGFASIGAGLDFFAGTQVRAPLWARRLSLEWLWRAATSPRRLGPRYAQCLGILPGQMLRAFLQRVFPKRS